MPNKIFVLSDGERRILAKTVGPDWASPENYIGTVREPYANLLSAAPELLAICQKLAERGAVIATTGLGEELNAAIQKARATSV